MLQQQLKMYSNPQEARDLLEDLIYHFENITTGKARRQRPLG